MGNITTAELTTLYREAYHIWKEATVASERDISFSASDLMATIARVAHSRGLLLHWNPDTDTHEFIRQEEV